MRNINFKKTDELISYLLTLGINKKDIINLFNSFPIVLSYSIENIKQKIEDLRNIGYTRNDTLYMIKFFPRLISFNINFIKEKIDLLEELGYSHNQILIMTKNMPSIFSFNTDTLKDKIEFYKSIKLEAIFINKPKNLIQSEELSYARYKFYESIGITIDNKFNSILFINQKDSKKNTV